MADLYYVARTAATGLELYKVTPLGVTSLVADIVTGAVGSNPDNQIVYNNELYFSTASKLWKVLADGTTVQLVQDFSQVVDLQALGASLHPTDFVVTPDGVLHFKTDSQPGGAATVHEFALWKIGTDGVLQRDAGSKIFFTQAFVQEPMVAHGGKLYFAGADLAGGPINGAPGNELWSVDATGNAVQVADISLQTGAGSLAGSDPSGMTVFNGELYFSARNLSNNAFDTSAVGRELYKVGTDGQAHLVKDINPGSSTVGVWNPFDSNPTGMTVFNNALYFAATSGGNTDNELWRVRADGVTERVADIVLGTGSSAPQDFKEFAGNLYFTADTPGSGRELWKLDGTTGVTSQVVDLDPGTLPSLIGEMIVFNNGLYFTGVNSPGNAGLFKLAADGTTVTKVVNGFVAHLTLHNDAIYFNNNDTLVKLDAGGVVSAGGVAGPMPTIPSDMIVFGATPLPAISIDNISKAEGNSGNTIFTFHATLSAPSVLPITVHYATGDVTASAPGDYAPQTSGIVTFAPGQTSVAIDIQVAGDTAPEGNETFTVTLSAPSAGATIAAGSGTGTATILDDDAPLVVYHIAADQPGGVAEGGAMTFTVTRSTAGTDETVPFEIFAPGTTATAGADYTAPPVASVHFAAGDTAQTINIQTLADTVVEGVETITVFLRSPSNGGTIGTQEARGAINDATAAPVYSVTAVSPGSTAEGGTLSFTITRSATGTAETVPFTLNGTATVSDDYVDAAVHEVAFAPGEQSKTITITTKTDNAVESAETLQVTLGLPSNGGTISGVAGTATATIADATPAISIGNVSIAEGNSGTTDLVFTAKLSAPSTETVSVALETADGAATAPDDYTSAGGMLVFAPGVTEQTITVKANGDTTPEGSETFTISLFHPSNAIVATPTATGTILDDDLNSAPVIVSNGGGNRACIVLDSHNRFKYEPANYVTTVEAHDPEGASITYKITGGANAANFKIDASTGVLSLLKTPVDGMAFNVEISAFDNTPGAAGTLLDKQMLRVRVSDKIMVGAADTSETFDLAHHFGTNVIHTVDLAQDSIVFDKSMFKDVNSVLAHAKDVVKCGHHDTVITYDAPKGQHYEHDAVTIVGVSKAQLSHHPDFFDFV